MTHPEFNIYRLNDREHWRMGVFDNLQINDDGDLSVSAGYDIQAMDAYGTGGAISAIDFSANNQLYWLLGNNGDLMQMHELGPQVVGTLSEAKDATKLIVGRERLWLLAPYAISSYSLRNLHPLRQLVRNPVIRNMNCDFSDLKLPSKQERQEMEGRTILDMADDGNDGVWWLEGGNYKDASLYHVDRYGCQASQPISLKMPLKKGQLNISRCGRKIVILDPEFSGTEPVAEPCGKTKAHWRIIVIDCIDRKLQIFDAIGTIDIHFKPQKFAIDCKQKIHLIGQKNEKNQKDQEEKKDLQLSWLWTIDLEGNLLARHPLRLPKNSLSITGIAAGDCIALATEIGPIMLHPAKATGLQDRERESLFISPTLISPDGTPHGWKRADIEVVLPAGTAMQVKYAATRDSYLVDAINKILADDTRSSQDKINQINKQVSWREKEAVLYAGSDNDGGAVRVRFPLHQVDEMHLWLSFTLYTPPGRKPPVLKAFSVYYPNISYLDYLPAVYQQDPVSALQLQSFLAIFEAFFGDLDTLIDQLPDHIDPETAPEAWLPFLLGWLGLPSPESLNAGVRRKLLQTAPELLAGRGTYRALQQLLEIITGGSDQVKIEIEDIAARPMLWILQPQKRQAVAARLGCDTLIAAQQRPAFRLGNARLGFTRGIPLGIGRADLQKILASRTGELKITIKSAPEMRKHLEPIINIFLPYFVPAHCRYRLEFVPALSQKWQQKLNVDFRLQSENGSELGKGAILGDFHLPVIPVKEIVLDHSSHLDSDSYLN
jgi:phage tail-like protein